MEALVLAGGKAERLGGAAQGQPKPLVPVAGRPLVAHMVVRLAAAGVDRVILACAAGQEELYAESLAGLGPEIVPVGEPDALGRGGGLRHAATARRETGPVLALNGDEILDCDFEALLAFHERSGAAATIVVAPLVSPFGVVDLDGNRVAGFREGTRLPHWVNAGLYVLGDDALACLPERGDHEQTTFPELAAEGRLAAFRHEGLWLTVNTPKDLRRAEEALAVGAAS